MPVKVHQGGAEAAEAIAAAAAAAPSAAGSAGDVSALAQTFAAPYADAEGVAHSLTLKRPHVLAGFRLVRLLDPEVAQNGAYVDMIGSLLYVSAVDGIPQPFPQSEREIEGLISRLDTAGMTALMEGLKAHFFVKKDADGAADRDAIKN